MIWHIFKKDWKLTWPLVLGVALINLLAHLTQYKIGHFGGNPALGPLLHLLLWSQLLGSILVIAAIVHQDPTPGVRQDWLVRPIKRSDLLLEKLIFVLLLVQGPMLATDILRALLEGFSFDQSLAASFSRALFLLFTLYLPALAFASLTANFTEAIVAGVIAFLGGASFGLLANTLVFRGQQPQLWVEWSGLAWINESERGLLALTVGVTILGLQYFRRNTLLSRWLFGGGVLLWVATLTTPWQPAFAVQERLSPNRGTASSLEMTFDPSAGKLASIIGTKLDERRLPSRDSGDVLVGLPLDVTGWPSDTMLKADRSDVRIMGEDGKWLTVGAGEDLELGNDESGGSEKSVHHVIKIPAAVYERLKDTSVQMEISYSLTLMGLSHSFAIPALRGDERITDVGWCKTRVNDARTSIQLSCLRPGLGPNCASVFLENTSSGQRNPVRAACTPNYSPWLDTIAGDAVIRMGMTAPFRDASGLAHFPVDGSQLPDARMVARLYSPVGHFSRRVLISSIRLSDWVTQ
jgi:ABC-type transport system involved in multi-copper enzyme maturation permease subunit